jgi:hypothetical protein
VKVVAGSVAALLSIAFAVVGVGVLDGGLTGLCLGLLAGRGVLSVAAPLAVGRLLGVRPSALARATVRPALATALLFGAGHLLGGSLTGAGWLGLVAGCAVTVTVTLPAAFWLGLGPEQRRRLVRRGRRLRARRERAS